MECPKCGNNIPMGGKYCAKCGAEAPQGEEKKKDEGRKMPASGKGKKRGAIIVMAVLSLVGGIFAVWTNQSLKAKEEKEATMKETKVATADVIEKDEVRYAQRIIFSETIYDEYLLSLRDDSTYENARYAIIDINQDGTPELLVYKEADEVGYEGTLSAYTYQNGQVTQLLNCPEPGYGHGLEISYSSKYKALVTYGRTSSNREDCFWSLDGTSFSSLISISRWTDKSASPYVYNWSYKKEDGTTESFSYSSEDEQGEKESDEKYNKYMGSLKEIPFYVNKQAPISIGGE